MEQICGYVLVKDSNEAVTRGVTNAEPQQAQQQQKKIDEKAVPSF